MYFEHLNELNEMKSVGVFEVNRLISLRTELFSDCYSSVTRTNIVTVAQCSIFVSGTRSLIL